MKATILLWAVAIAVVLTGNALAQEPVNDTGPTADKQVNTGQDPTKPLTRFDIRLQNDKLPYDERPGDRANADTIVFRVDAPIPLGKNGSAGTLSFRTDIPMMSVPSSTPGESGEFELGSVFLQFLHIAPPSWGNLPGASAWGWGYAMQADTATNGRQKRTDIGVIASKWNLNDSGGIYTVPIFKYYYGAADLDNGSDKINEMHFQPIFNFAIPKVINFITLWGNYDWVLNFEDGEATTKKSGDYFIPYDITFGKMLSQGKVVVSVTFAGELLADDFVQFDDRIMLRFGFFF